MLQRKPLCANWKQFVPNFSSEFWSWYLSQQKEISYEIFSILNITPEEIAGQTMDLMYRMDKFEAFLRKSTLKSCTVTVNFSSLLCASSSGIAANLLDIWWLQHESDWCAAISLCRWRRATSDMLRGRALQMQDSQVLYSITLQVPVPLE